MANQYYYTVSSLPMIFYDSEKFMTEEEFFECCETTITAKDLQILKSAAAIPGEESAKNPVLEKWDNWEKSLRNELVKLRAGKRGHDSEKYLKGGAVEPGLLEVAREAFSAQSPLDGEIILNRARWEYLEMLESGHFFDLGKLIIYYLQLKILHRKEQINKEKGKSDFEKLYTSIKDNADLKEKIE